MLPVDGRAPAEYNSRRMAMDSRMDMAINYFPYSHLHEIQCFLL
jgi:hypothetical protein